MQFLLYSRQTHQKTVTQVWLLPHCGMILAPFLTYLCLIVGQVKNCCFTSSYSELFASR